MEKIFCGIHIFHLSQKKHKCNDQIHYIINDTIKSQLKKREMR